MPLHAAVAEALDTWREAERLLAELPPLSPDHETVALVVAHSREVYGRLTGDVDVTADVISRSHERMARARDVLQGIREDQLRRAVR